MIGHLSTLVRAALVSLAVSAATLGARAAPPDGFADVVARVRPAVVNVAAVFNEDGRLSGGRLDALPEQAGEQLDEILRRFLDPLMEDTERVETSLGSGFIIDPTGFVVTSAHVIGGAERVYVTMPDGQRYAARRIGQDEETDLALLKIDARGPLPFVPWGDSEAIHVGDWVIAVGNPFGLGGTVTAGIISARGRDIQSGPFDDYLQIDASINRGNSGGPSFNVRGEVIGINSLIYSTGGGSIGIGFATPSALARPVADELRLHGQIARGWLGVMVQPVTREIAEALALPDVEGALVSSVTAGSPAAKAGLAPSDVVLAVGERAIRRSRDLPQAIASTTPGTIVRLTVWRDGARVSLRAKLEQSSRERVLPQDPSTRQGLDRLTTSVLGIALLPINPETRSRFGIPEDIHGALVANVQRPSSLFPGDIISRIGRKPVAGPQDVVDGIGEIRRSGRKAALFLVLRKGVERYVAVPLT